MYLTVIPSELAVIELKLNRNELSKGTKKKIKNPISHGKT
ncbi:hypothetical protein KNP414_04234 [Paenibacillus mucilaginosus KNP414]|uniref:Uncharacterized protein n=1 Tax=Paenibacillus mucilaginosus (strain KNP414) TaxID=1036673 RepID=F8FHQ9_PAEMK|nr:hypothetical protein KNP414_04234 [Paenibacillus mucilaginosus KNP414]